MTCPWADEIEVKEERNRLVVAVHDDGPGIPEGAREDVLTPFFRLEADRGETRAWDSDSLSSLESWNAMAVNLRLQPLSPLGGTQVTTFWPRSLSELTP